jgi:protein transport protein YIF1
MQNNGNIPFMDIFAYTGYKYIGLCIGLVALVFGKSFYFILAIILALSLGYFIMKTLAKAIPETASSGNLADMTISSS